MSTKRFIARAGVVTVAAGVAALFSTGLASAHVTARVIGEAATQGGYTKITFRVPNEDDAAGTVKLEVQFPADSPLAAARTKPMPGWTAQVNRVALEKPIKVHGAEVKEAVGSVVWTAQGTRINPGEFQEFELSVGPLPDNTDELVMPAIQTYDNNTVVAWDAAPPEEGAEEPEHPAPVIELAPEAEGEAHGALAPAAPADTASTNTTEAAVTSTDDTARWLGGAGLVIGALGVGFGVGATIRARRTGTPATTGTQGDE